MVRYQQVGIDLEYIGTQFESSASIASDLVPSSCRFVSNLIPVSLDLAITSTLRAAFLDVRVDILDTLFHLGGVCCQSGHVWSQEFVTANSLMLATSTSGKVWTTSSREVSGYLQCAKRFSITVLDALSCRRIL